MGLPSLPKNLSKDENLKNFRTETLRTCEIECCFMPICDPDVSPLYELPATCHTHLDYFIGFSIHASVLYQVCPFPQGEELVHQEELPLSISGVVAVAHRPDTPAPVALLAAQSKINQLQEQMLSYQKAMQSEMEAVVSCDANFQPTFTPVLPVVMVP